MKTCFLFLFWVACYAAVAQRMPGPDDFVLLDKEPTPINYALVISTMDYPKAASKFLIEGKVMARILVDSSGHYRQHVILKSPHPALEEAVTAKLPELLFRPAEHEGRARAAWVTLPFEFKLKVLDINAEPDIKAQDSILVREPDGHYRRAVNPLAESYAKTVEAIGYPKKALDRMVDGKVIVQVQFDEWGHYESHTIIKSAHPILEDAVSKKLDMLYMTPNPDGSPQGRARITIPFDFVLYSSGL
jgi:TonB family protein